MEKVWWKSRTNWFNIFALLVGAINEILPVLNQLLQLGFGTDHVATVRAVLILILPFANIALRAVTDGPVRLRK